MPEYDEKEAQIEKEILESYHEHGSMYKVKQNTTHSQGKIRTVLEKYEIPLTQRNEKKVQGQKLEEFNQDWIRGMRTRALGKKYGVTHSTVNDYVHDIKYPYKYRVDEEGYYIPTHRQGHWSKTTIWELCQIGELREEGLIYKEIAAILGMNMVTVIKQYKIYQTGIYKELEQIYKKIHIDGVI